MSTSVSLKVRFLSIVTVLSISGCYYDKEGILYPEMENCITPTNATFQVDVLPLLNTRCNSCHGGAAASAGVRLDSFAEVSRYVKNGSLMGSINQTPGYSAMPKGTDKLPPCDIDKIQRWVNSGGLDN